MDLKQQFVTYEIALKLKELRFDEECLCTYALEDRRFQRNPSNNMAGEEIEEPYTWKNSLIHKSVMTAPLWQQVIDWFREKYKLHITITSQSQESWQWHIQFPHDSLNKLWEEDFYFYEEAREAAILKAIKLCQNKKSLKGIS